MYRDSINGGTSEILFRCSSHSLKKRKLASRRTEALISARPEALSWLSRRSLTAECAHRSKTIGFLWLMILRQDNTQLRHKKTKN